MNKQDRQKRIQDLTAMKESLADDGLTLSERNQKQLDALVAIDEVVETEKRGVTNFRKAELGDETDYGKIIVCPVCQKNGAARQPKWGGGCTIIVHSIEPVPTIADLIPTGSSYIVAPGGRSRLAGDFHMVGADGEPVRPPERTKKSKDDVDAEPKPVKPVRQVSASRSEAAKRAWETMRAKRTARATATV